MHASQVRPFWGYAVRWVAFAGLILYLGGASAVFLGLRLAGKAPVSWVQVAWPRKWQEIPRVQSKQLFKQAIGSFSRGRLAEARLALTTARQLDPANYDAALLLAQISMFQRSYSFSDTQFMTLWREHPENRARTAIVYHDTLVSLDRMDKLAEFSVVMATNDPGRAAVWIRSALLAVRSMRAEEAAGFGARQAGALLALAPHARLLVHAELALQAGDDITALAALHKPFGGPFNFYYAQYQIERLAGLGATGEAQAMLDQKGPLMGDFEHLMTQAAVSAVADDHTQAHGSFRALLRLPLAAPRVERLATLLIAHPDPVHYRELHLRVRREPRLEAAADGATMWIAGIACGAPTEAAYWRTHGRQPPFANYPAIEALDFSSRDILSPDSVCHLVNVVSLPRDVILALLWRVPPARTPSTAAVSVPPD